MKSTVKVLLGAAIVCIFFSACSKGNDTSNTGGSAGNTGGSTGSTAGPLFAAVKPVLQANCAISGCHTGASPQNGINFGDDATIVAQKARIKLRAIDQAGTVNQMPPPPRSALSATDQKKITDWINAGGRLTD